MKAQHFFAKLFEQAKRYSDLMEKSSTQQLEVALLGAELWDEETQARWRESNRQSIGMDELDLGLDMLQELHQDRTEYFWIEMYFDPKKKKFLHSICEKKGLDPLDADLLVLNKMRLEYEADPEKYEAVFDMLEKNTGRQNQD